MHENRPRQLITIIFTFFLSVLYINLFAQINQQQEFVSSAIERLYPIKTHQGKKIKTIEVELGLKRENTRIEKTGKKYIFYFDEEGKIETFLEVVKQEYDYDSIFTFHHYNKESKMHIARTFSRGKYSALYETFDDSGRLIKYLQCQETNLSDDFRFFKIGQQTVLQSESYQYENINEQQIRKKFLNDNNLVYKEGIMYYQGNPKLLKAQEFAFTTTGVKISYSNSYDEKGRLTETIYTSNAAGELKESTRFTYDDKGLVEDKYYRNSSMKNQRFYFYQKENNLLESIISKSSNGYLIEIYNFNFIYYP